MPRLILAGVLACALMPSAFAEVRYYRERNGACQSTFTYWCIEISGPITGADVPALAAILSAAKSGPRLIYNAKDGQPSAVSEPDKSMAAKQIGVVLNSEGGDLYAAIRMGRMLREVDLAATAFVATGNCYSACVFVLAGAVQRIVLRDNAVGLHRPYSTDTSAVSREQRQAQFDNMQSAARTYLREMNVSPGLFDVMVTIPPEQIRLVGQDELAQLGMPKVDPIFEEVGDAAAARRYGISRQEYLRRKALAAQCLPRNSFTKPDVARVQQEWKLCNESVYSTGQLP